MNASFHQSSAGTAPPTPTAVQAGPVAGLADQACCCVAKAVVRVVMPPAPGRPHETDLLLCGHHYRASRQALAATHARVYDLTWSFGDDTAWYHDRHDRSLQAAAATG
jgi:hypothetical protein